MPSLGSSFIASKSVANGFSFSYSILATLVCYLSIFLHKKVTF
jgi:hypothetical protein